jgi:hypothetical protein
VFSDQNHSRQTLYYFSGDVSNDGLRKSGLLKFCGKLGQTNALIKSASYLLHRDRYADLRDFILKQSTLVLQDDSGIPISYFDATKWNFSHSVTTSGRYRSFEIDIRHRSLGYFERVTEKGLILAWVINGEEIRLISY